eukprot:COSAG05_NODE_23991_length_254_cov_0.993548_1_plen_75_part_10
MRIILCIGRPFKIAAAGNILRLLPTFELSMCSSIEMMMMMCDCCGAATAIVMARAVPDELSCCLRVGAVQGTLGY